MNPSLNFELHQRQGDALGSPATELLYGGAASGGKSHLSRVMSILWALEIPGLQIYLFRRLYDDLIKNHLEGPTGFRALLAPFLNATHPKSPLIAGRLAEIVQGEIRFWNGSKIFLCHLQHQKDITKYYGIEMHVLMIEEATQFSEFMIRFLRSRMRIPDKIQIPERYKDMFPRAVYTSNPGGIGHSYIKKGFLDGWKPYEIHQAPTSDGGYFRQYIPARVDDNPSIDREKVKLGLSGLPPALVDALLNGNWNAVIGAYFPEIDPERHIIPAFAIPAHWLKAMSLDWGACGDGDPFSIAWYAVVSEPTALLRRGDLVCYRRWNGRGLTKVNALLVANGIHEREREQITYRVAGGDILQERGQVGPSIFESFSTKGIHFQKADTRRYAGWEQVRIGFVGENDRPRSYWFPESAEDLETIGNLQHDLNDPNDCAPGDDHDADRHRYMVMSRPWTKDAPKSETPLQAKFPPPTLEQLWDLRKKQLKDARR